MSALGYLKVVYVNEKRGKLLFKMKSMKNILFKTNYLQLAHFLRNNPLRPSVR